MSNHELSSTGTKYFQYKIISHIVYPIKEIIFFNKNKPKGTGQVEYFSGTGLWTQTLALSMNEYANKSNQDASIEDPVLDISLHFRGFLLSWPLHCYKAHLMHLITFP